ncbi:MAG: hypothetical protein WAK26_05590 [Terracidiphilus sp.]
MTWFTHCYQDILYSQEFSGERSTAVERHRKGAIDSLGQSLQHVATLYRAAPFFFLDLLIEVAFHAILQLLCKNALLLALAQSPGDRPAATATILPVVNAFDPRFG